MLNLVFVKSRMVALIEDISSCCAVEDVRIGRQKEKWLERA